MADGVNWGAVLRWEADWETLLPNHEWRQFQGSNWEEVMPPPRKQLLELLPPDFDGCCGVHAFSECTDAWLRLQFGTGDMEVDRGRLLQLAVEKGVLTPEGSSMEGMKNLVENYGIPLASEVPENLQYATELRLYNYGSDHMPFHQVDRTREQALKVIRFRELLCQFLDIGPVVLCYDFGTDYFKARQKLQPYCRKAPSRIKITDGPRMGHCVVAYGYDCPGGDVRTLRVRYQENMTGAPTPQPGRDLLIHPDAIDSFHVIGISNVSFTNSPKAGYTAIKQPTPPQSWWDKVIGALSWGTNYYW